MPPREPADCLHLLALMKLFLDQATRLDGVLVFGDVSQQNGEAFARRKCVDLVP